jgi:S-adenosylmethionine-diacylglycerol 3-amino-3-carboxypropyl transferase
MRDQAITVSGAADSRSPLKRAAVRSSKASRDGMLERLFAFAFDGLVYPQIWKIRL